MVNWLNTLVGETQAKLLGLLRRSKHTIAELSEKLGLTDNAVRTHVASLGRDGLVKSVGTRRIAVGKPAQIYALSAEGEELFPKAYAQVLGGLLEEIARSEGPQRAVELLRAVGRNVAAQTKVPADPAARVNAAAVALRSLGGDVDVERTSSGWRLQGFGCPLSAVTTQRADACELARALIEEITGQQVTECCERSPRPRCAFLVDAA